MLNLNTSTRSQTNKLKYHFQSCIFYKGCGLTVKTQRREI